MNRLRWTIAWVAFALLGCSSPEGEEGKIDRVVDEIVEAAGERDVGDIMEHVSEAYADEYGNGKNEIKGYFIGQFFRRKSLYVVKVGHEIQLDPNDPNAATSHVKALLAAGKGTIPDERDAQSFFVKWRKEEGDWRVIGADNRQLRAGDLMGD